MLIRLKLLVIIVLLVNAETKAQRNHIKLLSYAYNNNFSELNTLSGSESKFLWPNHSYSFAYERTIGSHIIVGLTAYFPFSLSSDEAYGLQTINSNQYNCSLTMKGLGWGYDSKYFFTDIEEGLSSLRGTSNDILLSPIEELLGGAYIGVSFSKYNYTNAITLTPDNYTGAVYNPNYSDSYTQFMDITKLGFRAGMERADGLFMIDYYFGFDINSASTAFNKSIPVELNNIIVTKNYSLCFGMSFGLSF